jgi:hypothetical protein
VLDVAPKEAEIVYDGPRVSALEGDRTFGKKRQRVVILSRLRSIAARAEDDLTDAGKAWTMTVSFVASGGS